MFWYYIKSIFFGFVYNFMWLFFKPVVWFFLRMEIKSKLDLRKVKGPLIIACNHINWLDPFYVGLAFPFMARVFPIRFAAWSEYYFKLKYWPFTHFFGSFPVYKGKTLQDNLGVALEILKRKGVVGIFPEGKIVRNENEQVKGKRGAPFLAYKTNSPILPVKIEGINVLSPSDFFSRKRKLKITFGEIFYLPKKEIMSIEDLNEPGNYIRDKIYEI